METKKYVRSLSCRAAKSPWLLRALSPTLLLLLSHCAGLDDEVAADCSLGQCDVSETTGSTGEEPEAEWVDWTELEQISETCQTFEDSLSRRDALELALEYFQDIDDEEETETDDADLKILNIDGQEWINALTEGCRYRLKLLRKGRVFLRCAYDDTGLVSCVDDAE